MEHPTLPKETICSDQDFIALFKALGADGTAKRLGADRRGVQRRRARLELKYKQPIDPPPCLQNRNRVARPAELPHRLHSEINDGVVLVGSDAHIWPGPLTTAMRAFIQFCKGVDGEKPKVVVLNGDVLDFPQISRHPPIGWESLPTVADEVEAAKEVLHQIEKAAFKARKIWTLGNHDARFETRLASIAPEYAQIHGVHLRDHFPLWEPCWTAWVNDDTVIKHRFKGGIHAPHNNAMWAGRTILTGHLHSAKVTPVTDYNGTRYGVDTGCLAAVTGRQFIDYTEDNPKNWISAFAVLTYINGELLWPELVTVYDEDHVQFRGRLIEV
jgi:hypothetical protein